MLALWTLANVLAHVTLELRVSGFGFAAKALLIRTERLNHLSKRLDLCVGSNQLLLHLGLRLIHVHGSRKKLSS